MDVLDSEEEGDQDQERVAAGIGKLEAELAGINKELKTIEGEQPKVISSCSSSRLTIPENHPLECLLGINSKTS